MSALPSKEVCGSHLADGLLCCVGQSRPWGTAHLRSQTAKLFRRSGTGAIGRELAPNMTCTEYHKLFCSQAGVFPKMTAQGSWAVNEDGVVIMCARAWGFCWSQVALSKTPGRHSTWLLHVTF